MPLELLNNDPNGFAWTVWNQRTPLLVAQIRDAQPFGPDQRRRFDDLLDEIATAPMRPLDEAAPDYDLWATWVGTTSANGGRTHRSCGRSRSSSGGSYKHRRSSGRAPGMGSTPSPR